MPHVQGDLAGVGVLDQVVVGEAERGVADADDVGRADRCPLHRAAVVVGAVVAVQVDDLVAAAGQFAQFGVVAGDHEVVQDQVVVVRAADPDRAAGQLEHRARAAEGAGGLRGEQGGPFAGVGAGQAGEGRGRAVGRVAEAQPGAGADVLAVDPAALVVGAVGAAGVLQQPVPVGGPQHGVVPGDPGVVQDDLAGRVAAEVVGQGRVDQQRPGVGDQDEGRRGGCARALSHAGHSIAAAVQRPFRIPGLDWTTVTARHYRSACPHATRRTIGDGTHE